MPLSRSRDYLSIGEVLEAVRGDFPEVSISKIRFLETEGLLTPERTPSGYRKFYEPDVARLRYILALQRDQFLPLKVIRERLSQAESNGGVIPQAPLEGELPAAAPEPAPTTQVELTRDELQQSSGLSDAELAGLCDFGLLASDGPYDRDDLAAASAARGLLKFGVEPRHLRMYRQFADRETAFFEQIISPVARRRDPDAQREAQAALVELAELSRRFRDAVLRSALRTLS
jgi:DNA-binding transcriptional MerR regulator